MKQIFTTLLLGFLIVSCVPKRQMDDMESKYDSERLKREALSELYMGLEKKTDDLQAWVDENKKRLTALGQDTTIQGKSLRQLIVNYDQLDKTYNELLQLQEKIRRGSEAEAAKYSKELESTSERLQEKEDKLGELQRALVDKENSLNSLSGELSAREAKVKELQSIIDKQDSAVNALRQKISAALLGFENKGLTITHKNGKVYVSLENELLFTSGSYVVGKKGKKALKQLASVLRDNEEINISVEGHTDIDKYSGSGSLKDNWDLSVIRATQIVKILEGYKVNPTRLTAAGRGEFQPLDTDASKEAKRKNRRTEIILTPKLDELFKILEK
ncbi:MAG: chemotaxis protein MotB [Saprospiraceae bacterium]|jgi:chemotaxis protein MotB